jgi:[ribosomal protein S18]-alanine N-acetyltransferase
MSANESFALERHAGGIVVAFCEILRGVDDAEILNIETLLNHRRQGLAASLLKEALDWARLNQRTAIWLEVRAGNSGARALYTQLGFQIISTRKHYYADGEDALVMKYTL